MKNKFFYSLVAYLSLLNYSNHAHAQSWNLFGGNSITTTEFLGATATSTIPLNIRMDAAQPINFSTNGNIRMTLFDGAGTPFNAGYLGIGTTAPARLLDLFDASNPQLRLTQTAGTNYTDFISTGAVANNGLQMYQSDGLISMFSTSATHPSYIKVAIGTQAVTASTWNLTIHNDDNLSVVTQYTNGATGSGLLSGFITGIASDGTADILQREEKPVRFSTNGTIRMTLFDGAGAPANAGFLGIGTTAPARLLDLFDASNPQLRLTQTAGTNYTDFISTGAVANNGLQMYQSDGLISMFSTSATHPSYIKVAIGTQAVTASTWNLTIHNDDNLSVVTQYTNGATGSGLLSGFITGIASDGTGDILQREQMPIRFSTNNTIRMTLFDGAGTPFNAGYLGIGTIDPQTMLHIAGDNMTIGGGWRNWMHAGTFYNYGTDCMYVGMKVEDSAATTNRKDAIIAWGDDLVNNSFPADGPDNLRFIFNEDPTSFASVDSIAKSKNGLEVARFMPLTGPFGSFVSINMGIGNYYANLIPPMRRLEVLDGYNGANAHVNAPQLRLTYTQNADITKGIYTDFETMYYGDLYITPANSTHDPLTYGDYKTVGIDWPKIGTTFNPDTALDVNGQTNLRTVLNQDTLAKVLVWDSTHNGNVKWRRASTLGIGNVSACTAGSTDDFVTKWINTSTTNPIVCTSQIFDDGLRVSIGYGATYGPQIPFSSAGFAVSYIGDGSNTSYGIFSDDVASSASYKIGIHGRSGGASVASVGVQGQALLEGSNPTSPSNIGGHFDSQGGTTVYSLNYPTGIIGVYGSARGGSVNYGVYGSVNGSQPSNYAGYFVGDVGYTGTLNHVSDSILKVNVQSFTGDSALIYLRNLKPKTYEFDNETYSYMNLPANWQYGLVAQDVNRVLPNLVKRSLFPAEYDTSGTLIHDTVGYCGLNYEGLIPILVAGEKQLDSLQNALPNKLNNGLSADTTTHMLQWGGSCLRHNTEIPMFDTTMGADSARNIYFSGQNHDPSVYSGNVGIGYPTDSNLYAKLNVLDSVIYEAYEVNSTGGLFHVTGTDIVEGYNTNIGINAINDVTGGFYNYGLLAKASNGYYSYGGWAEADGSGVVDGLVGYAHNGTAENIGLVGQTGGDGAFNAGVLGIAYGSGTVWAGYFGGNVYATGSFTPSDSKLKTNIQNVSSASALKIIDSLQPKTYTYNTQQFPSMALPNGQQYGLISEDVEKILPNLVQDSKTPPQYDSLRKKIIGPSIDFKALNYTGFVPILIAATKQLDSTNHAQQTKIDSLQAQLAQISTALQQLQNCCQQSFGSTQPGNREDVTLSNINSIILDQNSPNPFAEQTTINYTIPENVGTAQLIFSDINGQVIKTLQIQTRGAGSLLVYASNLSSGIYTYSLIADGKLIDTKKMTVQK